MSVAERLNVDENQQLRRVECTSGSKNTNTFVNGVTEFFSNVYVGPRGKTSLKQLSTERHTGAN